MRKSTTLKAVALSLGLAALMAPATMEAQINHGLLQNPYKTESNRNHSMRKALAKVSRSTSPTATLVNPTPPHLAAASPSSWVLVSAMSH